MRQVQVRAGNVGYRDQLDRTRRFLERVEGSHPDDLAFQDMVWAFFQNCHHIRDWICNDPLLSRSQKDAILAKAGSSVPLRRAGDLCNGMKHLVSKRTRHSHVNITIKPGADAPAELDCMVEIEDGQQISAKHLARVCVSEWERILNSEQLATARRS